MCTNDPVFFHEGGFIDEGCAGEKYEPGWYFWSESYDNHGPFGSELGARRALEDYVRMCL